MKVLRRADNASTSRALIAIGILCSCIPAGAQSWSDIEALTPLESGGVSSQFSLETDRRVASPQQSITSKEKEFVYLEDRAKVSASGEMHAGAGAPWIRIRTKGVVGDSVAGTFDGKQIRFTLDPRKELKVKTAGLFHAEGDVDFFPPELIGQTRFGAGPLGKGSTWPEVLSSYKITSFERSSGGIVARGNGPYPYQVLVKADATGGRLLELTFSSKDKAFGFTRSVICTDWQDLRGRAIPTEGKFILQQSMPDQTGKTGPRDVQTGKFKLTEIRETTAPALPPIPEHMIFYQPNFDTNTKSAFEFVDGQFKPTADPGLVFLDGGTSYPLVPAYIGVALVGAVGAFALRRRRARR